MDRISLSTLPRTGYVRQRLRSSTGNVIGRIGLGLGALLLASCGGSSGPQALWAAASDVFLIREGQVETEDIYAAAYLVKIEGVIKGDLVVLATDRLEVTGRVEGDLIGFAPVVSVEGEVGGAVRLIGVDVEVSGDVGTNAVVLSRKAVLDGTVAEDALVWTRSLSAGGEVGRDLRGRVLGEAALSGGVGRDAEMTVGRMRLLEGARVGEDLAYRSPREAVIHPAAAVEGAVVHRRPVGPQFIVQAAGLMGAFLAFLLFLGTGMLWIRYRTEKAERRTAYLERHPLKSLLTGLAWLVPAGAAAGALAWAVGWGPPGWVIGTGLALLILGPLIASWMVYMVFIGPAPVLIAAGRRLSGGRFDSYGAFLISALLLGVLLFVLEALTPIPYAGPALAAAAVTLGLGTMTRGAAKDQPGGRSRPVHE